MHRKLGNYNSGKICSLGHSNIDILKLGNILSFVHFNPVACRKSVVYIMLHLNDGTVFFVWASSHSVLQSKWIQTLVVC